MIALLADVHAANHKRHGGPSKSGINRRCQYVLDALQAAVDRAEQRGAKALVVLGDLFDTTKPEPQIVRAVQRIFERSKLDTYILMGNHDQVSTQPGDHNLGPLIPAVARVVEMPTWVSAGGMNCLFVPFQPGPAVEWLPEVLEKKKDEYKKNPCLLLHLGLSEVGTPAYMRGAHDVVPTSVVAELCKEYGFDACFAGNWHYHKVVKKKPLICQVGTLCPTGWDNEGFEGHGAMVLWDGGDMGVEWVPGPRFVKMRPDNDLEIPDGHQVFLQLLAGSDRMTDALSVLQEAKDEGMVVSGEVLPDTAEVKAATRKAAMVARSSDTLDEALTAYVREMMIPEGVTREEVLEAVKGYLGGTA